MSIRMSELERAVHVERESMREEINRNRQEIGGIEKRLKEIVANDEGSGAKRVKVKR